MAKEFLKKNSIAFEDIDVGRDQRKAQEMLAQSAAKKMLKQMETLSVEDKFNLLNNKCLQEIGGYGRTNAKEGAYSLLRGGASIGVGALVADGVVGKLFRNLWGLTFSGGGANSSFDASAGRTGGIEHGKIASAPKHSFPTFPDDLKHGPSALGYDSGYGDHGVTPDHPIDLVHPNVLEFHDGDSVEGKIIKELIAREYTPEEAGGMAHRMLLEYDKLHPDPQGRHYDLVLEKGHVALTPDGNHISEIQARPLEAGGTHHPQGPHHNVDHKPLGKHPDITGGEGKFSEAVLKNDIKGMTDNSLKIEELENQFQDNPGALADNAEYNKAIELHRTLFRETFMQIHKLLESASGGDYRPDDIRNLYAAQYIEEYGGKGELGKMMGQWGRAVGPENVNPVPGETVNDWIGRVTEELGKFKRS